MDENKNKMSIESAASKILAENNKKAQKAANNRRLKVGDRVKSSNGSEYTITPTGWRKTKNTKNPMSKRKRAKMKRLIKRAHKEYTEKS